MPELRNCSCGAARIQVHLVCGKCSRTYPFSQIQITKLYEDYFKEKVSKIKKGNLFAAEQLIHFYENIDPQVSEIIKALRDTAQKLERSNHG